MTKLLSPQECTDKNQVGNKAFNLAKLKLAGFKVPDFFVLPVGSKEADNVFDIFKETELISVRSGASVSLPGMMVSFLNVTKENVLTKIKEVQDSWTSEAMEEIKKALALPESMDTAVILQSMVPKSILIGAGVASSIHPISKEKTPCLSYTQGDYGQSVVIDGGVSELPESDKQKLFKLLSKVDELFGSAQEIEFCLTTEGFYLLQSRDIVLTKETFNDEIKGSRAGQGMGSHQGVVSGRVVFSEAKEGDILCVKEANPSAISSLIKAKGVLARSGDHNSHLAILCRILNKPYILSAKLTQRVSHTDVICLDTNSGTVWIQK